MRETHSKCVQFKGSLSELLSPHRLYQQIIKLSSTWVKLGSAMKEICDFVGFFGGYTQFPVPSCEPVISLQK